MYSTLNPHPGPHGIIIDRYHVTHTFAGVFIRTEPKTPRADVMERSNIQLLANICDISWDFNGG